jgi:dephospho-CoA kinase
MKLAFIGKLGSGKSSLADYMVKNYDCSIFRCAGALKKIATEIGMMGKDRSLLQKLGYMIRSYDTYFFAKALIKEIGNSENVVVDDVRYEEEYELLKENGFIFIKLDVSEEVRCNRLSKVGIYPTREQLNHDSESHIDNLQEDYKITDNIDLTIEENISVLECILDDEKIRIVAEDCEFCVCRWTKIGCFDCLKEQRNDIK